MIRVIYDPSGRKVEDIVDMADKLVNFMHDHGTEVPIDVFVPFFIAGKIRACGLENDDGQIEELCTYQLRDRYHVNRGLQVCVTWYRGNSVLDFAASLGRDEKAKEMEYIIEDNDQRVVYQRRKI
jgi:hypothetical protein